MTEQPRRSDSDPFATLEDAADAALGRDHDDPDRLPAHETDRDSAVGGGLMSQGGTAIDRGTDTVGGEAPRGDATDD